MRANKEGRTYRVAMFLLVMLFVLTHAAAWASTIQGSVEAAVEAAQLPPIQTASDEDLRRYVAKHELENHATRVLADVYAARILAGSFDIWSTARRGDESSCDDRSAESVRLAVSAKIAVLMTEFLVDRKKASAWVACELDSPGKCGQLSNVKKRSVLFTVVRLALGGWNTHQYRSRC